MKYKPRKKVFKETKEILLYCVACGKEYKKQKDLNVHMKNMGPLHDGRCAYCDEKFDTWNEHKTHVDLVHDGAFKYRCGFCDETFLGQYVFSAHNSTLTSNGCKKKLELLKERKKHVCATCGLAFPSNNGLNAHMIRVHDNSGKSECKVCHKVFPNSQKLMTHRRNNHDPATCVECGKFFKSKKLHRNHVIVNHTPLEEMPYRCTLCPKGFAGAQPLRMHMNTHTGEKPYKCAYCEKAYADASTRAQHEKSVHLGLGRHAKLT